MLKVARDTPFYPTFWQICLLTLVVTRIDKIRPAGNLYNWLQLRSNCESSWNCEKKWRISEKFKQELSSWRRMQGRDMMGRLGQGNFLKKVIYWDWRKSEKWCWGRKFVVGKGWAVRTSSGKDKVQLIRNLEAKDGKVWPSVESLEECLERHSWGFQDCGGLLIKHERHIIVKIYKI